MNKTKTFSLFSFYENGCQIRIQVVIERSGAFRNTGRINIDREHSLKSAIRSAKRRVLGFHLISLVHEGMGFHHINERDVVCIPKDIHMAMSHCLLALSELKIYDNKGNNSFQDDKEFGFLENPLFLEGVLG